jgi:CheY-like chemotaxis protein
MPLALIVEDDQMIRGLFREALEHSGFTSLLAASPRQAIELLDKESPDIAFIDLNMPGGSGTEVLSFIKRTPRLAHTKTVIVTANSRAESQVEALGADLLLQKPVSIFEMVTLAERLVSGG